MNKILLLIVACLAFANADINWGRLVGVWKSKCASMGYGYCMTQKIRRTRKGFARQTATLFANNGRDEVFSIIARGNNKSVSYSADSTNTNLANVDFTIRKQDVSSDFDVLNQPRNGNPPMGLSVLIHSTDEAQNILGDKKWFYHRDCCTQSGNTRNAATGYKCPSKGQYLPLRKSCDKLGLPGITRDGNNLCPTFYTQMKVSDDFQTLETTAFFQGGADKGAISCLATNRDVKFVPGTELTCSGKCYEKPDDDADNDDNSEGDDANDDDDSTTPTPTSPTPLPTPTSVVCDSGEFQCVNGEYVVKDPNNNCSYCPCPVSGQTLADLDPCPV